MRLLSSGSAVDSHDVGMMRRAKFRTRLVRVALVVAETEAKARDAAERVAVACDALQAVVDPRRALAPDAPRLWDQRPGNLCVDDRKGGTAAAAAAFARAAHVVELELVNNRVSGVPMEPRAAVAEYDAATGLHTLYAGGQGVNRFQRELAAALLCGEGFGAV